MLHLDAGPTIRKFRRHVPWHCGNDERCTRNSRSSNQASRREASGDFLC